MLDDPGVVGYHERCMQEHRRLFHVGMGNIESVADDRKEELSEVKYVDVNEGRPVRGRVLP